MDSTAVSLPDELRAVLELQRESFLRAGPPDVALRRNRIDRLLALVLDNTDAFVDALVADFGSKSRTGTLFTEILGMMSVIEHTRSNIPRWMRATKPARAARLFGIRAEVQPAPLGVVGIIGPWNFPLHLVVLPASAAFAAGNRVMIKMSEVTPNTADLLRALAPKYFDVSELAVVTGDAQVGAAFAGLPFDHLFFTGSPRVGALVQRAAADNLVPVTLELGGKNPVVVAPDAEISRAATRIALGRMVNGGQVCVCPDYVLVPEAKVDQFVVGAREALRTAFPTITDNEDYPACVNRANFERVVGLIEDAQLKGARVESVAPPSERLPDRATGKIAPTIVRDIDDSMAISTEEVFGPVLGVLTYRSLGEAVAYINRRPAPLVAYWFGGDGKDFRDFVANTRSGGVARNEFGIHMFPSDAPFGGVGNSGMGAYHGKAGFDTFSHRRSIVGTDLPIPITTSVAVPPFGRGIRAVGKWMVWSQRRRAHRRLGRGNEFHHSSRQ
ncbi:coniferyl aldehyde dehydrogenase [Aldersonia sp. NBC_00410]|uniref:coniferyl aldehyde dehydrogenase n=1 Tax=Aldersonia sp. NBC_00410 TaxID=2975954 RepID=UPI002252A919|nr:coniferyl aldehyde dehydrogenase [Aldersonia sp. NBC_00410]MCX5045356.1 coniferyl aldehyde dehydrogenase [Aldersonia sp. NBC_00410]